MKYNHKSLYALNKTDKDAIVYTESNQRIIRLTRANFDTEADFLFWKQWSDEDYHRKEKQDHTEADHTIPLEELPAGFASHPSSEIVIERRIEKREDEQVCEDIVIKIKGQLTEKQFRRLWMSCVEGLTAAEIASSEGKTHQAISRSIRSAKKKISVFFRK